MKAPKLELKNVKHFEGHDGMTGLNADLFINGVKCLHVHDAAFGGCFDYYDYRSTAKDPEMIKTLIQTFDDYIATLPEEDHEFGGKKIKIKVDRDWMITKLEQEWNKQRIMKKMKKQMADKILVGVPDGDSYSYYPFKMPLSQIPKGHLQAAIMRIKGKLKKGEVIGTLIQSRD